MSKVNSDVKASVRIINRANELQKGTSITADEAMIKSLIEEIDRINTVLRSHNLND